MLPVDSLLFSLGFAACALLVFLVGMTIMAVVVRTRVQHPSLKIYLAILVVMLAQWLLAAGVHIVGNLQFHPATIAELTQFPYTTWWIALVGVPERFLLGLEVGLILLSGRVSTRSLGGRKGRRFVFWVAVAAIAFVTLERLVNLAFADVPVERAQVPLRALWLSLGNLLTVVATGIAAVRMIASPRRVLFNYIGSSYKSLGWLLTVYVAMILGLALVGLIPGNVLGSVSQSLWYILTVSTLLAMMGLWNLVVGIRILTTSLTKQDNRQLHVDNSLEHYGLTERETEIVWLLAQGLVNKEVAVHLSLSESTIKNHIYNVYKKLGISSRAGLVNVLRTSLAQ